MSNYSKFRKGKGKYQIISIIHYDSKHKKYLTLCKAIFDSQKIWKKIYIKRKKIKRKSKNKNK